MALHQMEWKGSLLKSQLYFCGSAYKDYDVYLVEGNWIPNYDLVTLCDGGDPAKPWDMQLHGGGEVLAGDAPNHRIVRVYSNASMSELEVDD